MSNQNPSNSNLAPPRTQNLIPLTPKQSNITPINYTKNVSKDPWFWTTIVMAILLLIAIIFIYYYYSKSCITKGTDFGDLNPT